MRINLHAGYEELRRYLAARPATPTQPNMGFETLLGAVRPSAIATQGEAQVALQQAAETRIKVPQPSPMASIKFSSPAVEAPILDLIQPQPESPEEVPLDVKTPALLDARRVKIPPPTPLGSPPGEIKEIIRDAGVKHGIDPSLGLAVASAESSFDVDAVSADGHESKGIFQLLDSTAIDLLKRTNTSAESYRPFNPQMNADLGLRYLRYLHDIFSTNKSLPNKLSTVAAANSASLEKLAVAAYNAGEGRVASAQDRARRAGKDPSDYSQIEAYLPETTRQYVQKVLKEKDRFGGLTTS
jgi:soluble lytic murein transglycosylase-like protein